MRKTMRKHLNHSYRDFIACGETQAKTGLSNLPLSPDTYNALYDLAVRIVNPVMDYFGGIELTYGFCSRELSKHRSIKRLMYNVYRYIIPA